MSERNIEKSRADRDTPDLTRLLNAAAAHYQAGRLGDAEAAYRSALAAVPGDATILHNLGARRGSRAFRAGAASSIPKTVKQKDELAYASRHLTAIEINGTYYSTFKPDSWKKWRDETPDGFMFTVKGSRFTTNRRELAGAGESLERFFAQGMTELGDRLGPIARSRSS